MSRVSDGVGGAAAYYAGARTPSAADAFRGLVDDSHASNQVWTVPRSREGSAHLPVRCSRLTAGRRATSSEGSTSDSRYRVADALKKPGCDILCVTEGHADILPAGGHTVDAGPDWGYGHEEARRKVLVWSRQPWAAVDIDNSGALPAGRLAAGITLTALGPLTVVGVCIPWRDAHVRSGRKDRSQWQEHEAWLAGFEGLPYRHAKRRTVVLGDYNQRLPCCSASKFDPSESK